MPGRRSPPRGSRRPRPSSRSGRAGAPDGPAVPEAEGRPCLHGTTPARRSVSGPLRWATAGALASVAGVLLGGGGRLAAGAQFVFAVAGDDGPPAEAAFAVTGEIQIGMRRRELAGAGSVHHAASGSLR
ncbi:hypothetical protein SGPA1_21318 [Streptomyces misionensis JCM 4497]